MPEMAQVARGVRMFLAAIVHYLAADAGIRQFLETVGPCLLRFSRCSLIAVAAAGLLLPEGFSRCCPQDTKHGVRGFRGDREHRHQDHKGQPQPRRGLAVITGHPVIAALAARVCQYAPQA
jgi:hypothetical protein